MRLAVLIPLVFFVSFAFGQQCFDAYDSIFSPENENLPYKDFHKLELAFLENLNGCQAIDFSVVSIDNNELTLSALQGKVVVLNFWFTTCLPCLKEIPELNKMVENYSTDEVVFIGMARESANIIEAFFKKFMPFKFQIVPESYKIADAYKVVGWPQTMVIDKTGKVYRSWAGLKEKPEVLKQHIEQAIDECLEQ